MEYLAVFLAVLFPGALVAFDNALLQALSRVASLRIYCAGVWHNAAVRAVIIPLLAVRVTCICCIPCFLMPEMKGIIVI